jgi:hypothetical protein
MTNSQTVENEMTILAELARIEAELSDWRMTGVLSDTTLDALEEQRRQYRNLLLAQAYAKRYPN